MKLNRAGAFVRAHWKIALVLAIVLLSYQIRLSTADMKYIQAFDPFFMYRYTEYIVDNGVLPQWDELSYYPPGRPLNAPPLMFYLTAYLYKLFIVFAPGMTLFVFAKYITAVYGAMSAIPAYLLGKELSNKEAGVLAALFVGINPSILSRTMAGFYDTDTIVIFFSLFTMYLFIRLIKRVRLTDLKEKKHAAWREVVMTATGVALFALAWGPGVYIGVIAMGSLFLYALITFFRDRKRGLQKILKDELAQRLAPAILAFATGLTVVQALGYPAWQQLQFLLIFARDPSQVLIVNISVAELQHATIFAGSMQELFARISVAVLFTLAGAVLLFKRDRLMGSLLITWTALSMLSITQGIRFLLVFAPAAAVAGGVALGELYSDVQRLGRYAMPISLVFFAVAVIGLQNPLAATLLATLTAVVIVAFFVNSKLLPFAVIPVSFLLAILKSSAWGFPIGWNVVVHTVAIGFAIVMRGNSSAEIRDALPRAIVVGTMMITAVIAISHASQLAGAIGGESISGNWESALTWLRDSTSDDAVVGTWWDPGHQLAGFSGKRVIADGAHCADSECKPGLNTRITDLGFIFATSDEEAAVQRLLKYRGDSSEVYWIVSDDLIGKFRWLQYFGTGCDGVGQYTADGQSRCPLYSQLSAQRASYDQNTLQPVVYYYDNNMRVVFNQDGIPIVIYENDGKTSTFAREIANVNNTPQRLALNTDANSTLVGTVWVHPDYSYLVYVPPQLDNSMFTRMFLYEDKFEHFEMVYKNKEVKIYKLKLDSV
ncbi:MAG: hypothetical protein HY366_00815 [Candidatus Aenigmarchaeota archaeon]|nr:hypothetical protein [Candidatus Aenigmarchaeota archaeon]